MVNQHYFRFRHRILTLLAGCAILATGCNKQREIQTYETEPSDRSRAVNELPGDAPDATLTAMIPREQVFWFFKLTGPTDAVKQLRVDFDAIVKSITFDGRMPKWTTPDDWTREEGSEMRLATLRPKDNPDDVEVAISMLPRPGVALGDAVASNVNRWRQQLQLPPAAQEDIAEAMERVELADGEAMVFLFAGKRSTEGPPSPGARAANGLPANHPPVASTPPSVEPAPKEAEPKNAASDKPKPGEPLTFEPPAEWREGPSNSFRYASFLIGDSDQSAEVRISKFPADAGPQMTSLAANLNRWRRELGLPPVESEEAAEEAFESMEVGGSPAKFIAIASESDATDGPATQVAMVTHGDMLWFFKLMGDKETVVKESERFKAFLETVEFEME